MPNLTFVRSRPMHIGLILSLAGAVAGCGASIVESIGFGTGGSAQCSLTVPATTFPAGSDVQFVAEFQPALPAGGTVKITVSRDGSDLPDFSGSVKQDKAQDCIYGGWPNLSAGHYHVLVAPGTNTDMPSIGGDFDITP